MRHDKPAGTFADQVHHLLLYKVEKGGEKHIRGYTQLGLEEREVLFGLKQQGKKVSMRAIACKLKRSHTTLLRELKRNRRANGAYIPCSAHSFAYERLHQQRAQAPLKHTDIYDYVQEKLKLKWSPETIAGRLKRDHPAYSIHHETIYRYIYAANQRTLALWTYLTNARKKRRTKGGRRVQAQSLGLWVGEHSIECRPEEVTARDIIGHYDLPVVMEHFFTLRLPQWTQSLSA